MQVRLGCLDANGDESPRRQLAMLASVACHEEANKRLKLANSYRLVALVVGYLLGLVGAGVSWLARFPCEFLLQETA